MSSLTNIKSPFKTLGGSKECHGQAKRKKQICNLYGVIMKLKRLTLKQLGLK